MSARQAFVPNSLSRASSSESHQQSADVCARDGDSDTPVNGNGKVRSVAAFLGQKRSAGIGTASQAARATQEQDLGRANQRRSFEGIRRPEMTPMSIIPYPPTAEQFGAGLRHPKAGQTPRKTVGPGALEFPRPMTPVSVPRGRKSGLGIFAESREDEVDMDANIHGIGAMFMPGGGTGALVSAGARLGGYMRVLEGFEAASTSDIQSNLEHNVAAPVPGYVFGELGIRQKPEGCEVDGMFARSSSSLEPITEKEVGMERNNDSQSLGGTKRGMRYEDMEGSGRYGGEGDQPQASTKKMKLVQQDPDEYFPISSPRIPPTPGLPPWSIEVLDPSLVANSLLENMEEFVNLEEIAADCKRWKECTREEWLKGADELAQGWVDILNMVKDYLTEKVTAYASMTSSVEERRAEMSRKTEIIQERGNTVMKNISKLGIGTK